MQTKGIFSPIQYKQFNAVSSQFSISSHKFLVGLYFSFWEGLHKGKKTNLVDKAFKGGEVEGNSTLVFKGVTKFSKDVNFLYLK